MDTIDEQIVTSARFAYRILITLCLAGFIFVFSPENNNKYQSAIEELYLLDSIDLDSLVINHFLKDNDFKNHYDQFNDIFEKHNLNFNPIYQEGLNNDLIYLRYRNKFGYTNIKNEEIKLIYDYLTSKMSVLSSLVIADSRMLFFLDDVLSNLQIKNYDYKDAYIIHENNILSVMIENKKIPFIDDYEPDKSLIKLSEKYIIFSDELKKQKEYQSLFNKDIFLPNLLSVWNQISNENIVSAIEYLARKNEPSIKKIEVFGLTIPQNIISWTIPTMFFCVNVFFLIHLRYFYWAANQKPMLIKYPWVLVIPGKLPFLVSIVSVVVIPIFIISKIVLATWESKNTNLIFFSTLTGLASYLTIFFCIKTIFELRKIDFN